MKNIKNLLFDLGGVIMDIERMRAVRSLEAIGLANAGQILGEYSQQAEFAQLEQGDITAAQWRDAIRKHLPDNGLDISDAQIDGAFMDFLIGIPRHRLEELIELRKNYRIYLLSNTNPVMWDAKIKEEFKQIPGKTRRDYFDGIVTSFTARALKPSAAIFRYAEKTLGIKPEETLFFDDSEANCQAARALGWNAVRVDPETEFTALLQAWTAQ